MTISTNRPLEAASDRNTPHDCCRLLFQAGRACSYTNGGYTVSLGSHISHSRSDADERKESSTCRELKSIFLVIKSLKHLLESKKVKVFTVNQSTARIVQSRSAKLQLQMMAAWIFTTYVFSINIYRMSMDRSRGERLRRQNQEIY